MCFIRILTFTHTMQLAFNNTVSEQLMLAWPHNAMNYVKLVQLSDK